MIAEFNSGIHPDYYTLHPLFKVAFNKPLGSKDIFLWRKSFVNVTLGS